MGDIIQFRRDTLTTLARTERGPVEQVPADTILELLTTLKPREVEITGKRAFRRQKP